MEHQRPVESNGVRKSETVALQTGYLHGVSKSTPRESDW